jgi:putative flavoprotein involved in K+ transport
LEKYDVIVIGGGQSGLAMGYYLRRTGLSYVILDNHDEAGGAWQHTWKSLRLFSPAQWSSLPGMIMEGGGNYYPSRDETIEYLKKYEAKYALAVERQVNVVNVTKTDSEFAVDTGENAYLAKTIVNATGTFSKPHIPYYKGIDIFSGNIIHSSQYNSPINYQNKRVAIVGEGNSGAQILAEVSKVAATLWITLKEPRFLADDIDGRYLFDLATQLYKAQKTGEEIKPPSLGDIVMVDSVKDARNRNVLKSVRPFDHFTKDSLVWADGHEEKIDFVIFCTGFKPALDHLAGLNMINEYGRTETIGTKSKKVAGLWLVGYGNWTGFASATLIAVGRTAKKTVDEIEKYLSDIKKSIHA